MKFDYDVFVSYDATDAVIVSDLAKRLRSEGLRVWFDEWEIAVGDSIPLRLEDGLERSANLLLCMSEAAAGSGWTKLESLTFRFRDPADRERRFIPVRLDDAELQGSLGQLLYVDYRDRSSNAVKQIVDTCTREARRPVATMGARTDWRSLSEETRAAASAHVGRSRRDYQPMALGDTGGISSVAWSPDARQLASASNAHTIRLWDLDTGSSTALEGHTSSVLSVAWSPDARQLASASKDHTIRVWDLDTGSSTVLEGHTNSVWSVDWSPDARQLASASSDNTIRVWDLDTGSSTVLEGHTNSVNSVAWSPDARQLASASNDHTIRVWDLDTGSSTVLEGHARWVLSVAWSPDGRQLASASKGDTVRVWGLDTGSSTVLEGHTNSVNSVAWSPDARQLASASNDNTIRLWDLDIRSSTVLQGHTSSVRSVAWSPDTRQLASASGDSTIRLWNLDTRSSTALKGHTNSVNSVAWSPDARQLASASDDHTVRVWDLDTGSSTVLEGHTSPVRSVAWSPDARQLASASNGHAIRLWDLDTGSSTALEGHTSSVLSVAWSPDTCQLASASKDHTIRVWDLDTGSSTVLEGHTNWVSSVDWSPDSRQLASASNDHTVRVWDLDTGSSTVLEGHTNWVRSVAWSPDARQLASASNDHTIRVWDLDTGSSTVLRGHTHSVISAAWGPDGTVLLSATGSGLIRLWDTATASAEDVDASTVQYINAKVLLVGESEAGKSGIALRLAGREWEPTTSTLGSWATKWPFQLEPIEDVVREIWVWDFGGQADQRIIHQLYLRDAALAVHVFDGQREGAISRLWDWDRAVEASSPGLTKILVAGRIDINPVRASEAELEAFRDAAGYRRVMKTSAKSGTGCDALRDEILDAVPWADLDVHVAPLIFRRLRERVLALKDEGRVLVRVKELRDWLAGMLGAFEDTTLDGIITQLAAPGLVHRLAFGDYLLLRPDTINTYAQAVVATVRNDPLERGCIPQARVHDGALDYPTSFTRLEPADESVVLRAMVIELLAQEICFADDEEASSGSLLVFPSYFKQDRPGRADADADADEPVLTYSFEGDGQQLYTQLVVRIGRSEIVAGEELWKDAADFKSVGGATLGIRLGRSVNRRSRLELYASPDADTTTLLVFARFVHEFVHRRGRNVERTRTYRCPGCQKPYLDHDAVRYRLADNLRGPICGRCETRVPLDDELERQFASPEVMNRARTANDVAQRTLDTESIERILVGEAISIVAMAGQIGREVSVSDHGIDLEIEFKDDDNRATGRRVYVQLKSGDSHVRERKDDEVFRIRNARHCEYWISQPGPVMLVVRASDGSKRWMDISAELRRLKDNGDWPPNQVHFRGEPFNPQAVWNWRQAALGSASM